MASLPAGLQHPMPLRSPESPTVDLRHPTPDLQSLQGAYVGNIERLEEHAERMSEAGSDLGEEIRKLQLEQKLSDSRRSSLRSIQAAEEPTRHLGSRSRGASTSSYANSIVDVNGAARWGGYSPSGFVTSPVGSLRSGSFSQAPTTLQRQRSSSKASRLGQVVHPESVEEEQQQNRHKRVSSQSAGVGVDPASPTGGADRQNSPPPSQRSVSSFTRKYDQMAEEIREELRNSVILEQPLHLVNQENGEEQHYRDHRDYPDRPPTAASTDTTHQARTLWQDFDGVHCPDTVPEEPPTPTRDVNVRHSTLMVMEGGADLPPQGAPPPEDGMVFYPAPVPRMLNLPKRLSQMPQASTQARRRTQLLDSMQTENRKSAHMLSEQTSERQESQQQSKQNRKSRQNLAGLPPQLRASAFFDQPAPAQEYAVKGESAEATLDSILEASAHAPVSAFTDHPFAGHVGNEVYGREQKRRTAKPLDKASESQQQDKVDATKRRSSINLLDTHRNSSGDPLNKLKKRNSSADLNMLTVRASESRMSLGDELDDPDTHARGPDSRNDLTPTARSFDDEIDRHPDDELQDEEEYEEEEPEEQYFGPPTTLLAELQMRKQQQKSRNLTAATAFPNGIHSTLLELDAVAEVEKRKRLKQKVHLAWEAHEPADPNDEDSDDEVPLGMLYPGRDGLANKKHGPNGQTNADWDRPIGLIAQRELEDNEPLSKRRTRLLGVDPSRARDISPGKRQTVIHETPSQQNLTVPASTTPQPESEGDEGETLAQRIRRLKNQQTLDKALGDDVRKSVISMDFASEMMSQLGIPEEDKDKPKTTPSPGDGEEETLGQRRARLQAEALARGDANPRGNRPPLRGSMSMADILAAHPIDNTNQAHKVSDEQLTAALPQGSLLYKNAMKTEQMKTQRLNQNMRMSSYGNLDKPLLGADVGKNDDDVPLGAKIQAYKEKMAGTGNAGAGPQPMMFNGQSMNNMPSMNLPGQRESFYPQANMGMMGMTNMNGMGMMNNNNVGMMQPNMMAMNMGMMKMPMQGFQYPQVSTPGTGMGGMSALGGGMRHSSMMNMPMNMQMGGMGNMGAMGGMGGMAGMPMQQNMMMMEPPMDPRQRDLIDRWRQGVMH